jgi:hypothetical protein
MILTYTLQGELERSVGRSITKRYSSPPLKSKGRLRRKNESFSTTYRPGLGNGSWFACMTASLRGEMPKEPGERSLSLLLVVSYERDDAPVDEI